MPGCSGPSANHSLAAAKTTPGATTRSPRGRGRQPPASRAAVTLDRICTGATIDAWLDVGSGPQRGLRWRCSLAIYFWRKCHVSIGGAHNAHNRQPRFCAASNFDISTYGGNCLGRKNCEICAHSWSRRCGPSANRILAAAKTPPGATTRSPRDRGRQPPHRRSAGPSADQK